MIRVHSYESMGTFDGPGLRLVVFLQGCNFRCLYCANPDTIDTKGESTETTIDEIVRMAVSQKAFFGKKGGVTFSGGEPTLQAKALIPLFQRLKEQSIHICIDTNGSIWNEEVKELLQWTDLVLLDIKEFNNVRHRQLTERSNEQTIRTAGWLEKTESLFGLRYVLVPGYSSFEEDIRALGEHFKNYTNDYKNRNTTLSYIRRTTNMKTMGKEYKLNGIKENTLKQLETAKTLFGEYFNTVYLN